MMIADELPMMGRHSVLSAEGSRLLNAIWTLFGEP
jgi:hypothetical protein